MILWAWTIKRIHVCVFLSVSFAIGAYYDTTGVGVLIGPFDIWFAKARFQ